MPGIIECFGRIGVPKATQDYILAKKDMYEKQGFDEATASHKALDDFRNESIESLADIHNQIADLVGSKQPFSKPKTQKDALQKRPTTQVVQRTPEGTGEERGERGRVEPIQQGQEIAKESEEEKLTEAEKNVRGKLGAFADLTPSEKSEWNDLSMAEKLELARKNLPPMEDKTEMLAAADARAKELLQKLHSQPQPAKPDVVGDVKEREIPIDKILPVNKDGQTLEHADLNVKAGATSASKGGIMVYENPDGTFEIADGFHRVAEAIQRGDKTIKAFVEPQPAQPLVKEVGEKKVYFHGTGESFKDFSNEGEIKSATGNPTSVWGTFFTNNKDEAQRYVKDFHEGKGKVVEANLKLDKPYIMSIAEFNSFTTPKDLSNPKWDEMKQKANDFKKELQAEGYDGIIIGQGKKFEETVVFDKSQISQPLVKEGERKEPIAAGMTDAEQLKFIAQQAQNVQQDGSVSDLQTPKKAYDAAVKSFGKERVDAAIKAHPLESLVAAKPATKKKAKKEEPEPDDDFHGVREESEVIAALEEDPDHVYEMLILPKRRKEDVTQSFPINLYAEKIDGKIVYFMEIGRADPQEFTTYKAALKAFDKAVDHFVATQDELGESDLPEYDPDEHGHDFPRKPAKEVFPKPDNKRNTATELKVELPVDEAQAEVQKWKDHAKLIGEKEDHSNEIIISFFDASGVWSKPYVDAGYHVIKYDLSRGDDIMQMTWPYLRGQIEVSGKKLVGILSAPPCTSFAGSGAAWWGAQHDNPSEEWVRKKYGEFAAEYFDSPLEYAKILTMQVAAGVEFLNPSLFHVAENPVGRIQKIMGWPDPALTFQPNNFGDPYTKKTMLWGKMNTDLPTANVNPTEGSKVHGLSSSAKAERSQTPEGFAYAFFIANNTSKLQYQTDEQSEQEAEPRDTETLISATETLISQAETATKEEEIDAATDKIEAAINEIESKIGKLKEVHSTEGIAADYPSSVIGKNVKKEITRYAKSIAKQLGWTIPEKHGIYPNIAPAGGDVVFNFDIPGTPYRMYVSAKYEPEYGDHYDNYTFKGFFYRLETLKPKGGTQFIGGNQWQRENIAANEMARILKKEADKYVSKLTTEEIKEELPTPEQSIRLNKTKYDLKAVDSKGNVLYISNEGLNATYPYLVVSTTGSKNSLVDLANNPEFPEFAKNDLGVNPRVVQPQVTAVPVKRFTQKIAEKAKSELDDLFDELNDLVNKQGITPNPEDEVKKSILSFKIVAKATETGIYKFADIVAFGLDKLGQNFDAIFQYVKKAYLAYQGEASDEILAKMDNTAEVRNFNYDQFKNDTGTTTSTGTGRVDETGDQVVEGKSQRPVPPIKKEGGTDAVGDQESTDSQRDTGTKGEPSSSEPGAGISTGKSTIPITGNEGLNADLGGESKEQPIPEPVEETPVITPLQHNGNFVIPPDFTPPKSFNVSQKVQDNIDAIKILVTLKNEKRKATYEEQKTLFKYVGWGGLKEIGFDPDSNSGWVASNEGLKPKFRELHKVLKELDEYGFEENLEAMRGSIKNAHYTAIPIIRAMYNVVRKAGFKGGRVIEPSSGIGHFIGAMPIDMMEKSEIGALEKDFITGAILRALYPNRTTKVIGYEEISVGGESSADLVISNIPFGDYSVFDPSLTRSKDKQFKASQKKIHAYFFARALHDVKPNGIVAFITSTGILDSASNSDVRKLISERAEFMGAFRIPNDAFKGNANTSVTTDIIFLRKFGETEDISQKHNFLKTKKQKVKHKNKDQKFEVTYNEYFHDNPEMILGTVEAGSMYGASKDNLTDAMTVTPAGIDLEAKITELADRIVGDKIRDNTSDNKTKDAANAYIKDEGQKAGNIVKISDGVYGIMSDEVAINPELDARAKEIGINPDDIREDNLYDADIVNLRASGLTPQDFKLKRVIPTRIPKKYHAAIEDLIPLRTALNQLYAAEYGDLGKDFIEGKRSDLNKTYKTFVNKHGTLLSNKPLLNFDVDGHNLAALENVEDKKVVGLADIFTKRVFASQARAESASNIGDAISLNLSETGNLDLGRLAELLKTTPEEVIKIGSGIIFKNPMGEFETKDKYLSGDVRKKLAEAKIAARSDVFYEQNVAALEAVQPVDLMASQIYAPISAPWIANKYIEQFASQLFNQNIIITKLSTGRVNVDGRQSNTAVSDVYGTSRKDGFELLEEVLQNRLPIVTDTIDKKTVVNEKATGEAVEKAEKIKKAFAQWIWLDDARRNDLVNHYNVTYNNVVLRKYDGSHLIFEGYAGKHTPMAHQKDGVWMITQQMGGILDHIVGSGKTLLMVLAANKMKRMGLIKKPIIVGLKANAEDIARAYKDSFPLAKVLYPRAKDFTPDFRKAFFAKMANNDWDAIVMTHDQFGMIEQSKEIREEIISNEIQALEDDIRNAKDNNMSKRDLYGLEVRKQNLQVKLQALASMRKDPALKSFDEMGIDFMFVDESQQFKNLQYSTIQRGVSGLGDPLGSDKAFNMLFAIRTLQKRWGADKGTVFASGTPISNTMVEMYLLFKYLRPNKLLDMGINSFDNWANTFANIGSEIEFGVTNSLKPKVRMRDFMNIPEMAAMYREIADVRNDSNLDLKKPKFKQTYRLKTEKEIANGEIVSIGSQKFKSIGKIKGLEKNEYYISLMSIGKDPEIPKSGEIDYEGGKVKYSEYTKSDGLLVNIAPTIDQRRFAKAIQRFAETKDGSHIGMPNLSDKKKKAFMLLATNLAAKMAIDMRLINPSNAGTEVGKLGVAANTIVDHYKESNARKGIQLIFSDLGTPKSVNTSENLYDLLESRGIDADTMVTIFGEGPNHDKPSYPKLPQLKAKIMEVLNYTEEQFDEAVIEANEDTFNIYQDMKNKLVKRGIPAEEIAFIHDYKTDAKRKTLFEDAREGRIRVIIGSTAKLGTGVNVQNKIVAMHHLDVPWRPSDMEQRNGRGVRQGNKIIEDFYDNELPIYYYATEATLDAYKYQLLDTKQKFIDQGKTGEGGAREISEGEGDEENGVSYAAMTAMLSGNPVILEKAKVDKQVKELDASAKAFEQEKYSLKDKIVSIKRNQKWDEERVQEFKKDKELFDTNAKRNAKTGELLYTATIDGEDFTERVKAGEKLLDLEKNLLAEYNRKYPDAKKLIGFNASDAPSMERYVGKLNGFDIVMRITAYNVGSKEKVSLTPEVTVKSPVSNIRYKWSYSEDAVSLAGHLQREVRDLQTDIDNYERAIEVYKKDISDKQKYLESLPAEFPRQKEYDAALERQAKVEAALKEMVNKALPTAAILEEKGRRMRNMSDLENMAIYDDFLDIYAVTESGEVTKIETRQDYRAATEDGAKFYQYVEGDTDTSGPQFSIREKGDQKLEDTAAIVKEYMDEGIKTDLESITDSIVKLTGKDTPALRKQVKEAFDYYNERYIPKEIHTGVIDRIKQTFGKLLDAGVHVYESAAELLKAAAQYVNPTFQKLGELPDILQTQLSSNPKIVKSTWGDYNAIQMQLPVNLPKGVEPTSAYKDSKRDLSRQITEPIEVIYNPATKDWNMMDGNNRLAQALKNGEKTILANVGIISDLMDGSGDQVDYLENINAPKYQIINSVTEAFYSPLERFIEGNTQNTFSPEQILGQIRNKNLPAAEIEAVGLEDFLRGKSKVTRQELLDYVRANKVNVQVVVKSDNALSEEAERLKKLADEGYAKMVELQDKIAGGNTIYASGQPLRWMYKKQPDLLENYFKELGYTEEQFKNLDQKKKDKIISDFNKPITIDVPDKYIPEIEAAQEKIQAFEDFQAFQDDYAVGRSSTPGTTKFSQYTLPGEKSNYREVLLTLPAKELFDKNKVKITKRKYSQTQGQFDIEYDGKPQISGYDLFRKENPQEYDSPVTEITDKEIIEIAKRNYEKGDKYNKLENQQGNFISSHFDEPNIIAHIRLTDRVTPDGKRILFVEESQSDWAREGRKHGFKVTGKYEIKEERGGWQVYDAQGDTFGMLMNTREEAQKIVVDSAMSARSKMQGVPDMPFKDKWVELATKKAIQIAATEGYDGIAWINGEQTKDRYDLSKHVDRIEYFKNEDNTYNINVVGKNGERLFQKDAATSNEIEATVGKEMLDRITKNEGEDLNETRKIAGLSTYKGNPKILRDENLKVGGKWAENLYDKQIPNLAKQYAKQYGGKTTNFEISTRDGSVFEKDVKENGIPLSKDEALDFYYDTTGTKNGLLYAKKQNGELERLDTLADIRKLSPFDNIVKVVPETFAQQFGIEITPQMQAKTQSLPVFMWAKRFPEVIQQTNGQTLKAHPEYAKAKGGNTKSAIKVVNDLVKDDKLRQVLEGNENAIIVPVLAVEDRGNNKLPLAYAAKIAKFGGNKIASIFQTNKTRHTGAPAIARLIATPKFRGRVTAGKTYILADDFVTSGSTVRALKEFIEKKGGKVVLVTSLANASNPQTGFGGTLAIQPETVEGIKEKFKISEFNSLLSQYGIAERYTDLTNSQARYLLSFGGINGIRTSLNDAGLQTVGRGIGSTPNRIAGNRVKFQVLSNSDEVLGFTAPDGSIHLNGSKFNGNTPVHEAGHLWIKWAQQYRPQLYEKGMSLTDGSKYLKDVKSDQNYINQANDAGLKGKAREDFFRNEALATAIGDKGEQFISDAKKRTFKDWLNNLWIGVKEHFGIRDLSLKEIQNLTLDEFSKKVAADILSGVPLPTGKPKIRVPFASTEEAQAAQERSAPKPNEERRFTRRELLNPVIRPEAKPSIAANLKYVRQTNRLSVDEARRILDSVGEDQAFDLVVRDKDLKPAVRVVLGEILILRYNELAKSATNQDDIDYYHDKTIDIANFVAEELGTKPGQIVQALSLFERLSPEAQLRAEVKEVKKRAERKREKREKDVNVVAKKFRQANEETVTEIVQSKKIQGKVQKAENQTIRKAKDKIEQARTRRENIIKKYKGDKGQKLFSTVPGLSPEGIEFVGNLAKTYLDEGIANVQIIVAKILDHIKDAAGKDVTDVVVRNVNDIVTDNYEKYFGRRIATGLVPFEGSIADIIKNHYTVSEEQKSSLKDKFINDAQMDSQEATELAAAIEQEFNEIATRKKMDILHNDKMRFERIKNRLQGGKFVTPQQLYEKIIKFSNLGAFENEDLMDMIFYELGTDTLSKEQIATIISLARKIQNAPEGSPKSEATEDLLTYRANLRGVSWGETLQAIWYANVLSGYGTHIKNIVSTFFNSVSFFGMQAIISPRSIPFLMVGAGRGFKRGLVESLHTLTTGRSPIHIHKIETPTTLERKKFIGGYFNPYNYLKFVGRLMVAEDVLQFQALKEMKATQLAYMEAKKMGKKNPMTNKEVWKVVNEKLLNTGERYAEASEEALQEGFRGVAARRRIYELMERSRPVQMTAEAYGFAAKGTFNHEPEGSLGALTTAISVALDIPIGGIKPFRLLVPFTRIITNVANIAIDFSLLGYVRAIRGVRGFRSFERLNIIKGAYHKMTSEEKAQAYAKASLGIVLTIGLQLLTKIKGDDDEPIVEITGGGTGDYMKDIQLKQTGWQPYSIKIGGKYYSYQLTPLILNLSWIGNLNDREKYDPKYKDEDALQTLMTSVVTSINMIADMTWIKASADLMKSLDSNSPTQRAKDAIKSLENSGKGFLIPNAYTQLAQKIEQINAIPQKEVNNIFEQLIQDIPIARNSLNDKINALGDPVVRDRDLLISSETKDPVWKFLLDKKGWVTPLSRNSVIIPDGKNQEFERVVTEDEYYEFSKLRGYKIKAEIKRIMDYGAGFNSEGKPTISKDNITVRKSADKLTTGQLRQLLRDISGQATKKAKAELFGVDE